MEQVLPGADPDDPDSDPITESNYLKDAGDARAAFKVLMELCEADVRCLDAHAHLGNFVFDRPAEAIRHYEAGVRIGELVESARVLALLDLAMADGVIACWDAKYHYVAWRPVTAIPVENTIGNGGIIHNANDDTWMPLFATPAHPEYPSAHSSISGAAVTVLAAIFGDRTGITIDNDLMLGVTRSFRSFSQALNEVKDARVFAGIHFRFSCDDGTALGNDVGSYVLENALLPAH